MARILEVIPAKSWRNVKTGQTASLYGAVPYTSEMDKSDWRLEVTGYTWRLDNGTVGLGRMPAKTEAEALAIMQEFNARFK